MFNQLVQEISPCDQGDICRNSTLNVGLALAKCGVCRLAPGNEELDYQYWSGMGGAKHPTLEREKKEARSQAARDKQVKRLNKDRSRTKLLKKAVKAEKNTENVINSTVNSGRKFKDSDHRLLDSVTLDTKLQSNRLHPKVDLGELAKVREDTKRAKTMLGGLVLRNANDVGVVVFHEDDFAKLVEAWGINVTETRPRESDQSSEGVSTPVSGE